MKKIYSILLTSFFVTFLIVAGAQAKGLWQYGSFEERANLAIETGIVNDIDEYNGSLSQNLAMLEVLEVYEEMTFGAFVAPSTGSIPLPQDGYDTYITRALGSSDTTIYVNEHPDSVPTIFTLFESDGRTIDEKVSCTATSTVGSALTLTGCTRGISLVPVDGVIDESAGTGSSHSKNTRFAITDNINFSGKSLAIFNGSQVTGADLLRVGDGDGSGSVTLYLEHATSTPATRALIYYDGTNMGWSVNNGTDTFVFNNSGTVLAASSTKGAFITDSKVGVDIVVNNGLEFSGGDLTVSTSSSVILEGTNLSVSTSTAYAWTGVHSFSETTSLASTTQAGITGGLAPTGSIMAYATTTPPSGWLLTDGTSYATSTYSDLFSVIGYGYGGSGANFNVPSMEGRMMLMASSTQSTFDTLGETNNSATTTTLTTDELPAHTHTVDYASNTSNTSAGTNIKGQPDATNVTKTSSSSGSGLPFSKMPPYFTVNYIIKH